MGARLDCQSHFREGEDPGYTLAQLISHTGSALVLASVSSVTLHAFDETVNPTAELAGFPIAISKTASVFDSFQLDPRWTEDDIGYNFRDYTTSTQMFTTPSEGGHTYRKEYRLVTSDGTGDIIITHRLFCAPVLHA